MISTDYARYILSEIEIFLEKNETNDTQDYIIRNDIKSLLENNNMMWSRGFIEEGIITMKLKYSHLNFISEVRHEEWSKVYKRRRKIKIATNL